MSGRNLVSTFCYFSCQTKAGIHTFNENTIFLYSSKQPEFKMAYNDGIKLGCKGGVISNINSENSFTDTWLWRNSFSARSISLKWNPTEGLSGEPGQNWQRTKVTAWLSQSQTATSFRCWLPKASISLNDFKILEEQEWPDSNVPWLGYRGMNLLSLKILNQ